MNFDAYISKGHFIKINKQKTVTKTKIQFTNMYSNMIKFALAMVPVAMGSSNIIHVTETDLIYYSTEPLDMSTNSDVILELKYERNVNVWHFEDGSISSTNL